MLKKTNGVTGEVTIVPTPGNWTEDITPQTTVEGDAKTHNAEVEEILGLPYAKWVPDPINSETVLYGYPKEHLEQAIHQQLQKARDEAVVNFASDLRTLIERGNAETAMNIINNHSELDQDNK